MSGRFAFIPFTIGRAIPMPELAALQEKLHWIALSYITDEKVVPCCAAALQKAGKACCDNRQQAFSCFGRSCVRTAFFIHERPQKQSASCIRRTFSHREYYFLILFNAAFSCWIMAGGTALPACFSRDCSGIFAIWRCTASGIWIFFATSP